MDLKTLRETAPWDWPKKAGRILLDTLRDRREADPDRLLAAELAGELSAVNDELVEALLLVLRTTEEPEELRTQAAISLGPVLEDADIADFEDPEDSAIAERTFQTTQETLHNLYLDGRVPKEVRRATLEASVHAPRDWHPDAIRSAFYSDDEDWKLTAVFCMRFVRGLDEQILQALKNTNPAIQAHAVSAAGGWQIQAAWPHVAALVTSPGTDKPLLLAAIDAVAGIRPEEAPEVLADLIESGDEDIAEAALEALAMTDGDSDDVDDEDEGDEGDEDEDEDDDRSVH